LPRGVRRVGDDREAASRDRARDHREFQLLRKTGRKRREIGDRGIVVESGQERRADHERPSGKAAENRGDPPPLASAVQDERREKEADEQRPAQPQGVLVAAGGLHERDEEEEPQHHQRGVVRHGDRPRDEEQMRRGNGRRYRADASGGRRGGGEAAQFAAEHGVVRAVRGHDAEKRLPAEVRDHIGEPPIPLASNHHDGRGGEVAERAAHGDIDEQQAQRGVTQRGSGAERIKALLQEKRADGHRRGLRYERTEQRPRGQDGKPPGGGGSAAEGGELPDAILGQSQHGPGGSDDHDGDDKDRLRETGGLRVGDNRMPPAKSGDGERERDEPDAEDGLHLAQEMEHARAEMEPVPLAALLESRESALVTAGARHEVGRAESMGYRRHEEKRGGQVEGVRRRAVGDLREDAQAGVGVAIQGPWKWAFRIESHGGGRLTPA